MANFELVEKLRERANISYEEANAALDNCNGDLLEALIYLEKQGKVSAPAVGSYSSKSENRYEEPPKSNPHEEQKGESFTQLVNRFFNWCGTILHKANTNYFEVWRHNQKILTLPVTVLILLLIFAFWVALPLLIVGLFFSCRYSFSGAQVESMNVNSIMNSAADAAESLKNEVKNSGYHNDNKD